MSQPIENQEWYGPRSAAGPRPPVPETEEIGPLRQAFLQHRAALLACAGLTGAACALCFCRAPGWGINVTVFSAVWVWCLLAAYRRLGVFQARRDVPLGMGILLLGLSVAWTANAFVQLVSRLGIFLLSAMMLLEPFCATRHWSLWTYIGAGFRLLAAAVARLPEPFVSLMRRPAGRRRLPAILLGILFALPLCWLAGDLLASADPLFQRLVASLLPTSLGLPEVLDILLRALGWFFLAFWALYCSLSAQSARPVPSDVRQPRKGPELTALVFTGALTLIYLVFCGIQVLYLFSRGARLPEEFTYAEYARQGFFQLLFVSAMNLLLVLLCRRRFQAGRALQIVLTVLCACTYIMAASSGYRMILYVQAYGLTFLRILVLWFLLVLAVLLTGTLVSVFRPAVPLLRFFLWVCLCLWLVFAFARPDRIAARYNLERFGPQDDVAACLLYELSPDAVPIMAQYRHSGIYSLEWEGYLTKSIPRRYQQAGIRGFSFSLWEANKAAEAYGNGQ